MAEAELIYVVGASGSGKDSLMAYARSHLSENAKVVFTHRYITRPADAGGENHVALECKEFLSRKAMGCFSMSWYSHDTYYGIGIEVNQWLSKGINVVVNGSRGYLNQAARKYSELRPVLISVRPEILRSRLEQRGRESKKEIEQRLIQANELEAFVNHPRLVKIENNGSIKEAGLELLDMIQSTHKVQCA